MKELTPQDLGSSISILNYLKQYTLQNGFDDVKIKIDDLLNQYKSIMEEPDPSDKTLLPYNRRDAYSILEYLNVTWNVCDCAIGCVYDKSNISIASIIGPCINTRA